MGSERGIDMLDDGYVLWDGSAPDGGPGAYWTIFKGDDVIAHWVADGWDCWVLGGVGMDITAYHPDRIDPPRHRPEPTP